MTGLLVLMAVALTLVLLIVTIIITGEMVRPPRHTAGWAVAKGLPCDPGDLGLEYEQWWLDRPDGARLPVWEVFPNGDDASRAVPGPGNAHPTHRHRRLTIIFVHGWGHSRIDMLGRVARHWPAEAKSAADREVFYDLRGHGESEGSISRLGDGEDVDLLDLIDRLGGEEPIVLVGYSMGAVIAIAAAARADRPAAQRIAGIFAYAPYAVFHNSLWGRLKRAHLPARPVTDLALLTHRLFGVRPRDVTERDLDALGAALVILHGDDDMIAPIEQARWMAERAGRAAIFIELGLDHGLDDLIASEQHEPAIKRLFEMIGIPRDTSVSQRGLAPR